MIEWLYFASGAALMVSVLGEWYACTMPRLDQWNKRFFQILFGVLTMYILVCLTDAIIQRYPNMAPAVKTAWYFESLLSPILLPMFTVYLLHCCGEDLHKNLLLGTVCILWGVYFFLLTFAQFNDLFYYVTLDNLLVRGAWYPLGIGVLVVIMLLNLAGVIRRRSKLPKRYYRTFLVCLLPLTIAMIVHMRISVFLFLGIGLGVTAFSMFSIILMYQIEQYMRQQREIAQQRAHILVLQMRPHFIYNTMTSIYYLCDQDPQKAKQVTMDFTTYLRKNFTAIASDESIPFAEELEHTRAYLAVEQAQFEDSLFVDYDTPFIRFRLPPLTLQPIVENAVKHGMDPDSKPLHITIRTRETDSGSEIIVEDNGSGFEASADTEPHIALKNIQQRLKMMCRGSMEIIPRTGGGTVVKVTIPLTMYPDEYETGTDPGFITGKGE